MNLLYGLGSSYQVIAIVIVLIIMQVKMKRSKNLLLATK